MVHNINMYGKKSDLFLMKEISALCIEKEFHVLTDSSYHESIRNKIEDLPELLKKIETDKGKIIYKPFKLEMVMHSS